MPSSIAQGAAADGVEQRPVVGDQEQRAVEARAARPPAPRGSRGRGGWWARRGSAGSRPRRRGSPATAGAARRPTGRRPASRRPRRRTGSARAARGPCSASARSRAARPRARCPRRADLLGVLGEVAELDVVAACAACRPSSGRWPASVSISVVLPAPFGPTSVTCSPRSSHSSASSSSVRVAGPRSSPSSSSSDHAAGALRRRRTRSPALRPSRGSRSIRSILLELLERATAPGGSASPARKRSRSAPGARSRPAGARWRARAPARARPAPCARRARARRRSAPRPASSSSTAVPTASRNQRSWATRTTAASSVVQVALEPLQRGDVEVVGGLVEQQQVGVAGERAGQRGAGQLAAGEASQRPVEVVVVEAEPAHDRDARRASGSRRRARAAPGRARRRRASPRRRAARAIACSSRAELAPRARRSSAQPGEHVVAQRRARVARRALVVQRDPRRPCRATSWPASSRRSRRRASAAASSCRSRCGPDSVSRSRRSSLNETSANTGLPPRKTFRFVAIAVAICERASARVARSASRGAAAWVDCRIGWSAARLDQLGPHRPAASTGSGRAAQKGQDCEREISSVSQPSRAPAGTGSADPKAPAGSRK